MRISNKQKRYVFPIIILAIFTNYAFTSASTPPPRSQQWESIPITTEAQYKANITGGEGFQQIMTIVYSQSNPQTVYMGSDTTQVWKSTNGGETWSSVSDGINSNGVCSLLVHPKNENFVIAAGCLGPEVGRARLSQNRKEGIFLTTNGGENWEFIHNTEFHKQQSMGSLFAIDSRTNSHDLATIYAGTYNDGLLISRDSGKTWSKTNFMYSPISDIEQSSISPGTLYISTADGLFQYLDNKIQKIGTGLDSPPSNITISPKQPNNLFAATKGYRIYKSNDQGLHFEKSSSGLPPVFLTKVVDVFASPADASVLYAGTWKSKIKGPFYSKNAGGNWAASKTINEMNLTTGKGFWFPSPIAPHPTDANTALAASNGTTRILKTKNGGETWSYSGSGYTGGRVVDMAFKSPSEWLIALTDHGLWKTSNNGKTFTHIKIPGIHPHSIGAVATLGDNIILSIGSWKKKQLVISHNNGRSWNRINNITGRLKLVRWHPQQPDVIFASNYRSDDNGKNWVKLKHKIRAIMESNGDIVYAYNTKTDNVIESSNRGKTWEKVAKCNLDGAMINEMAADPYLKGRLYLATNIGVFLIYNNTCTKVEQQSGFIRDPHNSIAVKSIAVNPLQPNIIYAGRWAPGRGVSTGIYISNDYGKTWMPYNMNISSNFNVWSIEINPKTGTIYIGSTYGLKRLEQISN